jgi:poly(beta-D-mannuronate) C5 epimerase
MKHRARPRPQYGPYALATIGVVGLAVVATVVFGRTYRDIHTPPAPPGRTACSSALDPIDAVFQGLPSNTCVANPGEVSPSVRAVLVSPTQISMLSGGQVVRSILNRSSVTTLAELAAKVNDASWLTSTAGRVTLLSAVVATNGEVLNVTAPTTTDVVFTVRPGVFLAAFNSTLHLSGATFEASDTHTPQQGSRYTTNETIGRPFILAYHNSTMTVDHSRLMYLGRDWNASYGLAWSSGSTGSVTDSTFQSDFIGVYSNGAKGLKVLGNKFYNSSLYGIDPHSGSTGLDVENNLAEGSGRHGIIFSDDVDNGIVRNNVTQNNGLNGIMMDEGSNGNLIENNVSRDNKSDGITLASSDSNKIIGNKVIGNRVGIHVRGGSATTDQVSGNQLSANELAEQGVAATSGSNTIGNNSTQWRPGGIVIIWAVTALSVALALIGTFISRRRRRRRKPAGPLPIRSMV